MTAQTENGGAALVSLRNIVKTFGAIDALKNVSLDLRRGDVVGLVGDNGAGKSTLVKILSGAYEPTSGEISIEGASCALAPPAQAQRLGIETVYQDLALISSFTVAENFFLGRELAVGGGPQLFRFMRRGAMTEAAVRGLEELHIEIPRVRTQAVDRMSGGQRQLAAIARGAFWGSKLLLLDEPTAALGVRESREVLDLITRLSARGLTILMVTHNLEHLWSVCNRVIVMRRGTKVADMASRDTTMDEVVAYITGAKGERNLTSQSIANGAEA
ncbi:MAG TPA: ATP-binding cassette domain-containing protein [Roseiarcus sp.]|jgi:ABC-type sugar transport system ATPase subunit